MGLARREHPALANPDRGPLEVDDHFGMDGLVQRHGHEVDVAVLVAEGVTLDHPGHGQDLVRPLDLEVDQGVGPGIGVKRHVEIMTVDGHVDRVDALSVDDRRDQAGPAETARLARAGGTAGLGAQTDF